LTREEVIVLLEQNIVRYNDVACLVDTDKTKPSAGWKFLWQFDEFDRRLNAGSEASPLKKTTPAVERRQAPAPLPVEEIPVELLNISPEELMMKSAPRAAFESETPTSTPTKNSNFDFSFLNKKSIGISLGVLTIVFATFSWRKIPESGPERSNAGVSDLSPSAPLDTQNGPLAGLPRSMKPRRPAPGLPNRPIVSAPVERVESANTREPVYSTAPERGEIAREKFSDEDEINPEEEVTEQDILEARAFKARKLKAPKPKVKRALAEEDEEFAETSPEPEPADFPTE